MDQMESLEKLKEQIVVEDYGCAKQVWAREEWRVTQIALFKMALQMLPFISRRVVKLVFFGGLSEEEAARKLKMPAEKVHQIMLGAIEQLSKSSLIKLAIAPGGAMSQPS